jgi:hypothetical protein
MRKWIVLGLIVLVAVAAIGAVLWAQRPDPAVMHVFSGVRGPKSKAKVVGPSRANIAEFDRGGPHRLAILVTDPQSGWLGLVRGFRSHGVPVTVTQNPAKALRHRVALVYPIVSGRVLDGAQIRALAAHVRAGGTVLAFNLAGGGLDELFGVGAGAESNIRTRLRWTMPAGEPRTDELAVSSARETRIATFGYAPTTARVLARFEEGATATACRTVAVRRACSASISAPSPSAP